MDDKLGGTFDGIARIHVTSDAAGIQVRTAPDGAAVEVELLDRRGLPLADEHLELMQQGDLLDVNVRTVRDGRWRRGRVLDARLRITAPTGVSLDLHSDAGSVKVDGRDATVKVAAAAGAVLLDRINGAVDVTTNAGAIKVLDSHGDAKLRSDAGAIRIERQHAGTVDVKTSAGAIDASELHVDHMQASTEVGVARLRFERAPTSVDARCTVGAVEVALPRDRYRIDSDTGLFGRAVVEGLETDPDATRTVHVAATGMGAVKVVAAAAPVPS